MLCQMRVNQQGIRGGSAVGLGICRLRAGLRYALIAESASSESSGESVDLLKALLGSGDGGEAANLPPQLSS